MARYIDADSLYRRVKTHTNPYGKPTLDYKSGAKVLEMINQEPTADVVERSECEKWYHEYHGIKDALKQEKEYHRSTEKLADKYQTELMAAREEVDRLNHILNFYALQYGTVKDQHAVIANAKSEVAREIFEEIEKCFRENLPYTTISKFYLVELKKQYVGGERDERQG